MRQDLPIFCPVSYFRAVNASILSGNLCHHSTRRVVPFLSGRFLSSAAFPCDEKVPCLSYAPFLLQRGGFTSSSAPFLFPRLTSAAFPCGGEVLNPPHLLLSSDLFLRFVEPHTSFVPLLPPHRVFCWFLVSGSSALGGSVSLTSHDLASLG